MGATIVIDKTKIKGGAYHAVLAGTNLGALINGITVDIEEELAPVEIDQLGPGAIQDIALGATVTGTMTLVEWDAAQLRRVLNMAKHFTTGTDDSVREPDVLSGERTITGALMTLHPVGLADADLNDDITIPLFAFAPGFSVPLGNQVREITAPWKAYRDPADNGVSIIFGETAASGTGS